MNLAQISNRDISAAGPSLPTLSERSKCTCLRPLMQICAKSWAFVLQFRQRVGLGTESFATVVEEVKSSFRAHKPGVFLKPDP